PHQKDPAAMIALLVEHVIRSIAVGGLVLLALKTLRITDPRLERTLWRVTLATLLAMPPLSQLGSFTPLQAPALGIDYVELTMLPATQHLRAWNTALLCII